jgi:hypothetical protein
MAFSSGGPQLRGIARTSDEPVKFDRLFVGALEVNIAILNIGK